MASKLQVAIFITFSPPDPLAVTFKGNCFGRVMGTYNRGSCEKEQRSEDWLYLRLSPVVFQIPLCFSCGLFSESGSRFGTQSATGTNNSKCCLRYELHARYQLPSSQERRKCHEILVFFIWEFVGRRSSVGIATGYGLDGPESNTGGGEIFRSCPDRTWGPASLLYNWYRVFPGGKERPGRDADPLLPSSAVVKKE